ncbi:tRNA lysidine(34) synthetase TilS [Legionella yabuuchiae]|uniref:tRNA lysidine(34) synthetase TilS n=1 Tax=Legionella yabuuchiae TaxID=376727 RepID=UPI0010563C75|nr:tRNA lysidine(34) synthetase TilS [Legionella yabuuchiae]
MTETLVTKEWIARLAKCNKLFIGFSGGLDSTVLLHALSFESSLATKIVAVHVNHGISPNANQWQELCEHTAEILKVQFMAFKPEFSKEANLEEEARIARYYVFSSLMSTEDGLILAHHNDDQAETVLLNLFRGAGVDGLAAMPEEKPLAEGVLFRPLLHRTRLELERYAKEHQLSWVQDESNLNLAFSRNFIRHKIIPLLSTKWPGVMNNLSRTSEHCQEAQRVLNELAWSDSGMQNLNQPILSLDKLKRLTQARLTNVIRLWLRANGVRIPSAKRLQSLLNELILARALANPSMEWDNIQLKRYRQSLYLISSKPNVLPERIPWNNFPSHLEIKGLGWLQAIEAQKGLCISKGSQIDVRFRQGGETFKWHRQTKSLKKLWQEWQVPPWERDNIPLIYVNGQLAAVVGFAVSDDVYCEDSGWAIDIIR